MSVEDSDAPARLAAYRGKRRFDATPEPAGEAADREGTTSRFVVHEHHARRLHWDLRLEHDGALASWAIPNGLPDDPKQNRKAVHVEDHPLEYLEFAGTIPQGSYGAGEISVWDQGTFTTEKWRDGEVMVVFDGERLKGRYVLFRAGQTEQDWMIHRMDPPADPTAEAMPAFIEPMLAKLAGLPANEAAWAFEVKWDGVRAIARSEPGRLKLISRNENDVTAAYPELHGLNRALSSHRAILDGEIIAFDETGRPSFEVLQHRMHLRGEAAVRRRAQASPVTYVLFDLLWLDGHSLLRLPYRERRERLAELDLDGDHWRTPDYHAGEGTGLLAATREQRLEGIVAKRLDSRYLPGRRNDSWLKIKHTQTQEAVIGGWAEGKGGRAGRIGALHLGIHEGKALRYVGRVGSGFDEPTLTHLQKQLDKLSRTTTPFSGRQPARGAHFVEPRLVCEVEFTDWTRDGVLRHPVWKGLREDKPADTVTRELEEESGVAELIAAGRKVRGGVEIEVEGRTLKLTNVDKVLYPQTGFTKGDLIAYYFAVAPALLPHLVDRPLTMKRYPNGVEAAFFYEKQAPGHRPDWIETVAVPSGRGQRTIDYLLCQDLATLVWLGNLADLELHPSLSRAAAIERPATLAFDLDPGAPAGVIECCAVAVELHDLFDQLGLRSFAKSSGSKGLQVYVPLNGSEVSYQDTKPFAHAVARLLEQRHPKLIVSSMAKAARKGKVLIDWSQNDEHKTTVAVYSPRALETPTVSTPLTWEEVREAVDIGDAERLRFTTEDVLARVDAHGDLWAGVASLRQSLPQLG
jgi:bifunctional non-homologous end joining protein LigD